ncbi:MAG: hypothetical protein KBC63_04425 [Candidatus Levybacteria bacterium]|nr:hypothetical protein [Candidatus Levybacteria bacterium]
MSIESQFDASLVPTQQKKNLSRESLLDPSYLPKHEAVYRAFVLKKYFSVDWRRFCTNYVNPIFEFLNEEHLNALSDYLIQRSEALGASDDSPVSILEVGAGNGRLSHFLQEQLNLKFPGKANITATDSGKLGLESVFPVEKIDHEKALKKYKPKIVICSWMPNRVDFTESFRAAKSVNEYILIGEADGGCCGDDWLTWGISSSLGENRNGNKKVAPYIADGFVREKLEAISAYQICRSDEPGFYGKSVTISFKRNS